MLSNIKYAGLCVLGTEVFYVLCLSYGSLLSGKHRNCITPFLNFFPGLPGEIR